ncbi:fatty acyl-AMP ligase [Leptolyngbya ohadii]|uniref:fatty acyl-AMP ligase n=1 Tax=Leptolyngbya ohadii TaxID=1962290 RepID=UPI000B59CC5B|nr:fatty acyl-AMP ligase [Leptolyngbya ohadii]
MPQSTLVDLLTLRGQAQPQDNAFIFLKEGNEAERITYADLDRRARTIAAHLSQTVPVGSRALLVYPYEGASDFIAAFLGCLYAGVIAVPCHPPRNRHAAYELSDRCKDAEATIGLTTQSLMNRLKGQLPDESLQWLITANLSNSSAEANWNPQAIAPDQLAFLQYTSGSTGKPKGVMITHDCLMQNQKMLQLAFGHTERSIGVGWLPLFHDMGLIGNVLQAIYLGASCVLMSPIDFVQKPVRWLQAISQYKATTSGAPNFAYDLLCRQVTDAQRQQLDLSSWEVAFTGAEPVRIETLDRFSEIFAECGFRREAFYPCYGMAEATLLITGGKKNEPPIVKTIDEAALEKNQIVDADGKAKRTRSMVSCGQPWLDGKVMIVDPVTKIRCAEDRVGEIWVAGSGLGKGYWNQPELTQQTFGAVLAEGDLSEGTFLQTGDLGFVQDGNLFITGRLNDVMVFWGFNQYPDRLEQTVQESHPAFRTNSGAAFSVPVNNEDRLVIAQEVERSYRDRVSIGEVTELIRWRLFQEHFVDVYAIVLLKPGGLPKTPSGKIQRRACRNLFLNGQWDGESLGIWRSNPDQISDISTLIRRYLNPLTHLKRYTALAKGRIDRMGLKWK